MTTPPTRRQETFCKRMRRGPPPRNMVPISSSLFVRNRRAQVCLPFRLFASPDVTNFLVSPWWINCLLRHHRHRRLTLVSHYQLLLIMLRTLQKTIVDQTGVLWESEKLVPVPVGARVTALLRPTVPFPTIFRRCLLRFFDSNDEYVRLPAPFRLVVEPCCVLNPDNTEGVSIKF
jgi:hypothetical protein